MIFSRIKLTAHHGHWRRAHQASSPQNSTNPALQDSFTLCTVSDVKILAVCLMLCFLLWQPPYKTLSRDNLDRATLSVILPSVLTELVRILYLFVHILQIDVCIKFFFLHTINIDSMNWNSLVFSLFLIIFFFLVSVPHHCFLTDLVSLCRQFWVAERFITWKGERVKGKGQGKDIVIRIYYP